MSWKSAYLESRVLAASPLELVSILYEYAILRVQDARAAIEQGNVLSRNSAISKALAIIGELEGSLDHKAGGEVAANLAHLYHYMRGQLANANQGKSDAILAEVEQLLITIGEAWETISNSGVRHSMETSNPAWLPVQTMETVGAGMQGWTF